MELESPLVEDEWPTDCLRCPSFSIRLDRTNLRGGARPVREQQSLKPQMGKDITGLQKVPADATTEPRGHELGCDRMSRSAILARGLTCSRSGRRCDASSPCRFSGSGSARPESRS